MHSYRHQPRGSRLFHGDPVQRIGNRPGGFVVRDNDKLGNGAHLTHHVVKRPMFASSSGASTTSSRQNGVGLIRKIEMIKATAVSAFSPPDSSITLACFCGGLDDDVDTGLQLILLVGQLSSARAATEQSWKDLLKLFVDQGKGLKDAFAGSAVDAVDRL